MEIVKLNRQQLKEFIHSDEYKSMPYIPISYHRALSHINNPRANDDDILLILVYEKELIGYLGIIPDFVYVNNIPEKMAWMSCIWIHPNARGKGIAKKMTELSIDLYNGKIFATEFTPEAEALYNKLGKFDKLVNKSGIRIYRRSCVHKVIPSRFPKTSFLLPLFSLHDVFINLFHDLFLNKRNKFSPGYTVEFPDNTCFKFCETFLQNQLMQRSETEMKWFLNFPWIKETIFPTKDSKRYHFSSEARSFQTISIVIKQNAEIVAFFIVTVRDKHMKTPYLYVKSGHEKIVCETLNNLMCEYKTDILTTYNDSIKSNYRNSISFLKSKNITRKYLQSKVFNLFVNESMLQDGDGDCGFV
ncbi:MAG: GNAT family N-acetyltransferase [Bacteroidia bacterium]|nr:GNAT family N-acetyltransferase [Bacteroidia bacterium]